MLDTYVYVLYKSMALESHQDNSPEFLKENSKRGTAPFWAEDIRKPFPISVYKPLLCPIQYLVALPLSPSLFPPLHVPFQPRSIPSLGRPRLDPIQLPTLIKFKLVRNLPSSVFTSLWSAAWAGGGKQEGTWGRITILVGRFGERRKAIRSVVSYDTDWERVGYIRYVQHAAVCPLEESQFL